MHKQGGASNNTPPPGVSWRDYVDMRLEAMQEAVEKAERLLEVRLEGMNELRDQINRERGDYASREWVGAQIDVQRALLDPVRLRQAQLAGGVAVGASLVGLVVGVAALVLAVLI